MSSSSGDESDSSSCGGAGQGGCDNDGIWSTDIEQSFLEALAIYPPCGRRKIILSEEGKMYGRNELIARYIKLRTGKTRTRKQVSSHIQVLARRRSKEMQAQVKDQTSKERMMQSLSSMSSSQIVSATTLQDTTNIDTYPSNKISHKVYHNEENNNINKSNNSFYEVVNNCYINDNEDDNHVAAYTTYNETERLQHRNYCKQHSNENWVPLNKNNTFNNNKNLHHSNTNNIIHNNSINNHLNFKEFKTDLPEFSVVKYEAFAEGESRYSITELDKPLLNHSRHWPTVQLNDLRGKYPDELFQLMHSSSHHLPFFLVKYYVGVKEDLVKKAGLFYGVASEYQCSKNTFICESTKVCSFGREVVEKVEIDQGQITSVADETAQENINDLSRRESMNDETAKRLLSVYSRKRSPMCEYMVSFISKLLELKDDEMRASVLENLTVLKVIRDNTTKELLMGMAFYFELAKFDKNIKSEVYQIIR